MTSVGAGIWRAPAPGRRALLAAGRTDPGRQREVNEDRFHVDVMRGIFAVIDGVGGQAAGGRAADVALALIRERLERETGPVAGRIREAIAVANNEIRRLASTRAEWEGMACVLTLAVVNDGTATIGHVGDTRLYKLRNQAIEKITRDHSPVGEREDAGELSEGQAMRHPRRNEVYRDVGSEFHQADDADFSDLEEIAFEPDAALLLCTDGLTDLVDSAAIARIVSDRAGDPEAVVAALIDAANSSGGKDNVTVVYVEGEHFATLHAAPSPAPRAALADSHPAPNGTRAVPGARPAVSSRSYARRALVSLTLIALLAAVTAGALWRSGIQVPWRSLLRLQTPAPTGAPPQDARIQTVWPAGSIAEAIRNAAPGSLILVEPGEYREPLILKDHVRVVSRVPRGATIRLPVTVPDTAGVPAILAEGITRAELSGFRIVGDAATPLGVGIRVQGSTLTIVDVEITGARTAAIEFSGPGAPVLVGGDIRNNPGVALVVGPGAGPQIRHSVFARNGTSERAAGPLNLMDGSAATLTGNVFVGLTPAAIAGLNTASPAAFQNENWFVPVSPRRTPTAPVPNRPRRNR